MRKEEGGGGGEEKVLIMLCVVPLETNENGQDICMQSVWTHFLM